MATKPAAARPARSARIWPKPRRGLPCMSSAFAWSMTRFPGTAPKRATMTARPWPNASPMQPAGCSSRPKRWTSCQTRSASRLDVWWWATRPGGSPRVCRSDPPGQQCSRRRRPLEIGAQRLVDRAAIAGLRHTARRIVEGVIGCRGDLITIPHQVGHDDADAVLLVVEHDRRAALATGAQLKRAVGIVGIERLAFQTGLVVHRHIAMFEEHDMGGVLPGDALADGTVTGVIVDRLVIGMRVDMSATAGIFM